MNKMLIAGIYSFIGKASWSRVLEAVDLVRLNQVNEQKGENIAVMKFFRG